VRLFKKQTINLSDTMKKNSKIILIALALSLTFCPNILAQKEVNKSFTAKERLKINLVSGDCIVKNATGDAIKIHLSYTYSNDCFEYKFKEWGNELTVSEKFHGKCSGESKWKIEVPKNTKVYFNSASGNLEIAGIENNFSANSASGDMKINNLNGEITINTASGDLFINNINGSLDITTASGDIKIDDLMAKSSISTASGDVEIEKSTKDLKVHTASGDVSIDNSKGEIKAQSASGEISIENSVIELHASTASGNIEVENVELTASSEIKAASSKIKVKLTKSLTHNLVLSTASGNIDLDYNGNEVQGYFEFMAKENKGRIVSPFKFDKEEKIQKDGKTYDKKSFTKGGDSPKVYLKTASGTVVLEE
jgi:DUF4097 and DUF4098 domain-containing protein YvlB